MRFDLSAEITISVHTSVEADSLAEAIAEANKRSPMSLCHQCAAGDASVDWITSGELDGEVSVVTAALCDDEEVPEEELAAVVNA